MAEFYVYKYEFKESLGDGTEDMTKEEVRRAWTQKLRYGTEFNIQTNWKGTDPCVAVPVEADHHEIIVLQMRNRKELKQYVEGKTDPELITSKPYCTVIFDNRPGVQQLLIEKKTRTFNRPEDAVDILRRFFGREMRLPFEMVCRCKRNARELWEQVELNQQNGKPVKKVELKMGDMTQMDKAGANEEAAQMLMYLNRFNRMMGDETSLVSTAERFRKTNRDVREMVNLMMQNGYEVIVHFDGAETYTSTTKAPVLFSLEDEILEEHKATQEKEKPSAKLLLQLDELRNDMEGCTYEY